MEIINGLINCTVPDHENLSEYLRLCVQWDGLDKAIIQDEIVDTIADFQKSYWHDGKEGERERFMKKRKALRDMHREYYVLTGIGMPT